VVLGDDSLECAHPPNIAREGGRSAAKLGPELRESGHRGQCGKLGAGCSVVILLGEDADGTGGDCVVYCGPVYIVYIVIPAFKFATKYSGQ